MRYVQTIDKADGFFTFPRRDQVIGQSTSAGGVLRAAVADQRLLQPHRGASGH
ncbi:hypothetical protein AB5I41_13050 [Sphingomonas sp. MMS24-JH45]